MTGPRSRLPSFLPRHLLGRLYLLAAFLTIDFALLQIPHPVHLLGPLTPSGMVAFPVFLILGYAKLKAQQEDLPFGGWSFAAHLVCMGAVTFANLAALYGHAVLPAAGTGPVILSVALLLGIALLALACVPFRVLIETMRATSPAWLYAFLAGAVAWFLRIPSKWLWNVSAGAHGNILQIVAFRSVHAILHIFLPDLTGDAADFTIGTPHFMVSIGDRCSGVEGLALVLVFTIVWLWYFRKENRFPQALLLVPCALACIWLFNILRIAALILIGNAGAPEVALAGFHSRAGWIAFTIVALAFTLATQKLSWVRKPVPCATRPAGGTATSETSKGTNAPEEPDKARGESPATAAYLVPFLAILGVSFLSQAASGTFEWLYPLRFVAAAIAIWSYRSEYKKLNWRFGWVAPVAGAAIFLVWIAPAWWTHKPAASSLGSALAALSPSARMAWIAFRVAAAAITVPIAEELAFRGYLLRRLIHRDFDAVPFSQLTILSIGLSSAAYGLMHGQHWMAGIAAGLAYALALKWRGRMGDAVAAHAISNLMLAAWVLARGDWAQW
jgi:exosortase E/protease (VPEID-CTERM system)